MSLPSAGNQLQNVGIATTASPSSFNISNSTIQNLLISSNGNGAGALSFVVGSVESTGSLFKNKQAVWCSTGKPLPRDSNVIYRNEQASPLQQRFDYAV